MAANCGCKLYIQAHPCGSGTAILYLHKDNLPSGTRWIVHDGYCYRFDPTDPLKCRAPNSLIIGALSNQFSSCADCQANKPPDNSHDEPTHTCHQCCWFEVDGQWVLIFACLCPGSGIDCDGAYQQNTCGGWGFSLSSTWLPSTGQQYYYPTVCYDPSGTAPMIAIPIEYYSGASDIYLRYRGNCYYLAAGSSSGTATAGYKLVGAGGTFATCAECSNGVQAVLCPYPHNPPDTSGAPDVWAGKCSISGASDTSVRYFQTSGYCYSLDPTATQASIPATATLITLPPSTYAACTGCLAGVQAVLCPNQHNPSIAPAVWVEQQHLPPAGATWTFNYEGWCYSIDSAGAIEHIPDNVPIVYPLDEFTTCDDCKCLPIDPGAENVIQARSCGGNSDDTQTHREIFVPTTKIATTQTIYFAYGGLCYVVSGRMPAVQAPKGALIIDPASQYQNCLECVADNPPPQPPGGGGVGGGGSGGTGGGGNPRPPLPPPNAPPASNDKFRPLTLCYTSQGNPGTPINLFVPASVLPGTIIKTYAGICFQADAMEMYDHAGFAQLPGWMYQELAGGDCGSCQMIAVARCDGGAGLKYIDGATYEQWAPVFADSNGDCWRFDHLVDDGSLPAADITPVTGPFGSCLASPCLNIVYTLTNCENSAVIKYTKSDLSLFVGWAVSDTEGNCWLVSLGGDGTLAQPFTAVQNYAAGCAACATANAAPCELLDGGANDPHSAGNLVGVPGIPYVYYSGAWQPRATSYTVTGMTDVSCFSGVNGTIGPVTMPWDGSSSWFDQVNTGAQVGLGATTPCRWWLNYPSADSTGQMVVFPAYKTTGTSPIGIYQPTTCDPALLAGLSATVS